MRPMTLRKYSNRSDWEEIFFWQKEWRKCSIGLCETMMMNRVRTESILMRIDFIEISWKRFILFDEFSRFGTSKVNRCVGSFSSSHLIEKENRQKNEWHFTPYVVDDDLYRHWLIGEQHQWSLNDVEKRSNSITYDFHDNDLQLKDDKDSEEFQLDDNTIELRASYDLFVSKHIEW